MSDLTDFLLARIAEDEAMARGASGTGYMLGSRLAPDRIGDDEDVSGIHVDPARVLNECRAKRKIVESWAAIDDALGGDDVTVEPIEALGSIVVAIEAAGKALVAVYADHPDYREEWRP